MRIGDLAAATGASARSLRYYEEQGLLTSERSAGGQRGYPAGAVERVRLIRSLLAAGLTSATIREVLPCVADASIRTPWLAARLAEELERVQVQITELNRTRDVLAGLVESFSGTAGTVPSATRV
ncbi:MerR family transcriptional regulator [Actinoplanes sp. DH11]|uniref:MerR family transcriptional regulator n=1 Tax=Actinoplanes sp. DH11 TaxID=2857011 RepID=UPI001E5289EF|nr:MerR family transcriptional regulator [Actinoplanes sp. DH11]